MVDKVIPRQAMKITLSLTDGRNISGELKIDLDTRLSDFMNFPDRFIFIKDIDEGLKIINKDHIIDVRFTE